MRKTSEKNAKKRSLNGSKSTNSKSSFFKTPRDTQLTSFALLTTNDLASTTLVSREFHNLTLYTLSDESKVYKALVRNQKILNMEKDLDQSKKEILSTRKGLTALGEGYITQAKQLTVYELHHLLDRRFGKSSKEKELSLHDMIFKQLQDDHGNLVENKTYSFRVTNGIVSIAKISFFPIEEETREQLLASIDLLPQVQKATAPYLFKSLKHSCDHIFIIIFSELVSKDLIADFSRKKNCEIKEENTNKLGI